MTAVAKIFEQDHESAEAAATAAIEALDKSRRERFSYVVAVNARPVPVLYGWYENREEAIRWSKRVALDVSGLDVWVVPLRDRDLILERHRVQTEELKKRQEPGAPTPGRRKR